MLNISMCRALLLVAFATSQSSAQAQSAPDNQKNAVNSQTPSAEAGRASESDATEHQAASLANVFTKAQQLVDARKGGTIEMNSIIQPVAANLKEISVAAGSELATWQSIELNKLGTRFDAVRFRSPLDGPADMYWVFLVPPRIEWYLAPSSGTIAATKTWRRLGAPDFATLDLPQEYSAFFQPFEGGVIQPGEDYILWFSFPDAHPVKVHMIVRLVATGTVSSPSSIDELAQAIGLSVPVRSRLSQFRITRTPPADQPERKP